jgi:hypothetical protein
MARKFNLTFFMSSNEYSLCVAASAATFEEKIIGALESV